MRVSLRCWWGGRFSHNATACELGDRRMFLLPAGEKKFAATSSQATCPLKTSGLAKSEPPGHVRRA